MSTITLKGTPVETIGTLPVKGNSAPDFTLAALDLSEKSLSDFAGKKIVLNIFPSIDTSTCATSVRTFNKDATGLENTVVLCISADLPFAQGRFCGAEGIENVVMLSSFRSDFGKVYGNVFTTGPLKGLLSRSVVVIDEKGTVVYTEQVSETSQEPDYTSALAALK